MKKTMKVCWISAGVSSFIAGYLAENVDKFIYIDVADQHEDSMRFVKDCEKVLGQKIEIIQSPLESVENAIKQAGFINRPVVGSYCTKFLKKDVRKKWEYEHKDFKITYVWGFDCNERHRADRLEETMIEFNHEFPLIEKNLTKADAHAMAERLGVKRPYMYDLGYNNNNCIGCVKGGMGYWNKIRKDFPEVFERMARLEREIGSSCLNGIYLDELDPNRGRMQDEIMPDCSIMCYLAESEVADSE